MGPGDDQWVQAASFATRSEAEVARTALEATDIPVRIHADDAGYAGGVPLSLRGVEVRVPKDRWQDAREALGLPLHAERRARISPWTVWVTVVVVLLVSLVVALDVAG